MMQSSTDFPISNGQTITYRHTLMNRSVKPPVPVNINGKTITYQMKFRQIIMDEGTGTIFDGPNGVSQADITFHVDDIMSFVKNKGSDELLYVEVNVQFYADGILFPGRPLVEYVSPNVDDLASNSKRVIRH